MFPSSLDHGSFRARLAYRLALFVTLGVWLLPLFAVALTSARPFEDLARGDIWGAPSELRLIENYWSVLSDSRAARFVLNSFLITAPAVVGTLALSCMAGFALAKHRLPGAGLMLALFVAGNLMPFQAMMIPVRELMIEDLGLYDTRWALILFHIAFQTGFCTLFMRNFFRQLPDEVLDAARLDGVGEFSVLWRIAVPMVSPGLAGLAALVFTFVWNDYFWSLVLVHSDEVRPVTAGLQSLRGMWLTSWHLISAAAILAALPPAFVFFLMQRRFIAGLTAGAVED